MGCVRQRDAARVRCIKQLEYRKAAWKVLLVTAVAVFMSFLDVTIVNIAFPDIRRRLRRLVAGGPVLDPQRLQHRLRGAARAGRAAGRPRRAPADVLRRAVDASSPRRWPAGSRRASRSSSAARVVQAAGAAMLVPTSLALLLPEFPLEQRATATAIWGATGAVAAATGPSLGGLLVDGHGLALGLLRQPLFGGDGARPGAPAAAARRAIRRPARCPTPSASAC